MYYITYDDMTRTVLFALQRSIPLKMADNSKSAAKMVGILACIQIITGVLMLGFGIADRLVGWTWTGHVYFGIWIGIWVSKSHLIRFEQYLAVLINEEEHTCPMNVF